MYIIGNVNQFIGHCLIHLDPFEIITQGTREWDIALDFFMVRVLLQKWIIIAYENNFDFSHLIDIISLSYRYDTVLNRWLRNLGYLY